MNEDRDPHVVAIVDKIKSEGIFDALRKDCLADVDLKPAYQNLKQKVENACASFLSRIVWSTKLNKNQLREQMRKNLEDSGVLQAGVKRIVHQVVAPKVDLDFKPKVAQVVCEYLGLDPDDIHTEDDDGDESHRQHFQQAPGASSGTESSIGLYPFNPHEAPVNVPPGFPGFEEADKQSKTVQNGDAPEVRFEEPLTKPEELDKESDKQDDMDISDKSDSRSTSRASTKKSMDMDCTMTSDEEEGAGTVNGTDLSKGLAAYMATATQETRNDDDMSISSSDASSKQGQATPDPSEDVKQTTTNTSAGKRKGKAESDAPPVERREMRRQRTRNKKYMSDEFESIFTENKELLGVTYSQDYVEEEIITTDDMISQVVIEETETSTTTKNGQQSNKAADQTPNSSGKTKPTLQSQSSHNLRRSLRKRGAKGTSPEEPAAAPEDITKQTDVSTKPATSGSATATTVTSGTRRNLRSSKGAVASQSQTSNATNSSPTTPRRYTRSSAKSRELETEEDAGHPSSGSTPTQDEHPQHVVDMNGELPISLVVLSDICAAQSKLPSHSVKLSELDTGTASSTPVKDEPAYNSTDTNMGAPCSTSKASTSHEQLTESYEPELHFDELSRDVAQAAQTTSSSRSDVATPTMDEPTSPDRLTESPTSPTPSSPTESYVPTASCSMITIPLEGDDSYHSSVAPTDPQSIPLSPTGETCMPVCEQPPLPPELPPLPAAPEDELEVSPPPEPEPEGEEGEEIVFHVLSEVGADDGASPMEDVEGDGYEEVEPGAQSELEEEEDDDLEELERLAQRKLEILKAIELPDSVLEKQPKEPSSEEEEGQISDSSEEDRSRAKKKKSKKSKKKKSKKDSHKRKHHDYDEMGSSSKRSRYY